MKTTLLIGFITCCFFSTIFSQIETIHLKNPSFEDYPRAGRVPEGWRDCGFPEESPADTHPSGAFDIVKYPADENTYLGLVTRDNDTWERVSQKLVTPIKAGQCYIFKLALCRSELYVSASRLSGKQANYTQPIKLKIWGGDAFCDKKEALGESPLVEHTDWEDYIFTFYPNNNHTYLMLEAFYKEPILNPYNGNLLLDNASSIVSIPIDSANVWTIDKKESIVLGAKSLPVVINEEDIDETAKNMATVTATRIGDSKQFPPVSAIYYNSMLTEIEKELVLEEIKVFVENSPFAKVNIIIEEKTRNERKEQKVILTQKLTALGILEDSYSINLYKK